MMDSPSPEERALAERGQRQRRAVGAVPRAELVRETLAAAIITGELPIGWHLSEERLASIFSVSRTPIREALASLLASSLATRDVRGALRVAAVTPEQIIQVYAVCETLESTAARLASQTSSPRSVAKLRWLNEACRLAAEASDFDELVARTYEFHMEIAVTSANEFLIEFLREAHTWVKRFRPNSLVHPGRARTATEEHERIIEAIERHDSETAERLAREHFVTAEHIQIELLHRNGVAAPHA